MSLVGGVGVAKDALADGGGISLVLELPQLLNTSSGSGSYSASKQLLLIGH